MIGNNLVTRRGFLRTGSSIGLGAPLAALAAGQAPAWAAESGKALDHVDVINPTGIERLITQVLLARPGFLDAFGLDAKFVNVADTTKILAGLISGSGDICTGAGVAGLFPAIAKGAKLKILAGASVKPSNALFAASKDTREAKDLVGKTVGVGAPGALLHSLMVAYLAKEGVDYKQVKFVNVGSSIDVFKAVSHGIVDAGPGDPTFVDQTAKYGVYLMKDGKFWDSLPQYTNTCIFTTEDKIATKRDTLVKTLAVHAKLFRFLATPEAKTPFLDAQQKILGNNNPDEANALWGFYYTAKPFTPDLVVSEEKLRYLQELNVELGVQQSVLPYDQIADMSLAQDALKMLHT